MSICEPSTPRSRGGGTFVDLDKVNLHSNDFDYEDMVLQLPEEERALMATYIKLCFEGSKGDFNAYRGECPDTSWQGHYVSSRNHFPLKNYISHAFPVIKCHAEGSTECCIVECGCGNGSVLLPIMNHFGCTGAQYVGFDVSPKALEYFAEHPVAKPFVERGKLVLFECDVSKDPQRVPDDHPEKKVKLEAPLCRFLRDTMDTYPKLQGKEADLVLLIFVLSALPSINAMRLCLRRLWSVMKPGSQLLFRDYAVGDHNFFRFISRNGGLDDNICFKRSDGTTQVFFDFSFTRDLFSLCGFKETEMAYHCNRLLNRKTGAKMDKIFINCVFEKVADA